MFAHLRSFFGEQMLPGQIRHSLILRIDLVGGVQCACSVRSKDPNEHLCGVQDSEEQSRFQ